MEMSFLWESHGKRPMGWDRYKLLWDGNGTDKYVPWTTLRISHCGTQSINALSLLHDPLTILARLIYGRAEPVV